MARMRTSLTVARGAAAFAAGAALVVTALPWTLAWLLRERRERRRLGYRALWPFMARTLEAYAPLVLRASPPAGGWAAVAHRVDRYVAWADDACSPRAWRVKGLLVLMALAPMLEGRPPFALLRPAARRAFVLRRLEGQRGVFALVALGRQLVRLGYYSQVESGARMGFVPMEVRGRRGTASAPAPAPPHRPAALVPGALEAVS
jgi:hypothetical protein